MKVFLVALIPVMFLWARPAERTNCDRRFVAGLNNYAPFAFREKGQLQGVAHDIVEELSQRTHCPFQENEVSRPSAVEDLKRGRLDVMVFVVKSAELDRNSKFIPLFESVRELTVLKSSAVAGRKISSYVNDDKVKFAHLIGNEVVVSIADDKKLIASSRLIGVSDPESAFNLLLKGRAQVTLFSAFMTDYYVGKLKLEDKVTRISDGDNKIEVGVYVSKRRVGTVDEKRITDALIGMKNDGSLEKILAKYMGPAEARKRLGAGR